MQISIHALREEGDAFFLAIAVPPFLISIHALREEGDFRPCRDRACAGAISIHALREEGDPRSCSASPRPWNFYPRPPRGGRRVEAVRDMLDGVFLSTPSARRATVDFDVLFAFQCDFYPRPPRGGRQYLYRSYHTLGGFLSTPSARRATLKRTTRSSAAGYFYPRPPRGGRPRPQGRRPADQPDFYPRPPRGGRLEENEQSQRRILFLSTPSARRATQDFTEVPQTLAISIHALREEGDPPQFPLLLLFCDFYPRPPRGGRLAERNFKIALTDISIHALREEGDCCCENKQLIGDLFLSTPSARRATAGSWSWFPDGS